MARHPVLAHLRTALLPLALAACVGAAPPPGEAGGVWRLAAIDGIPFTARATLDLSQPGRLSGQAPCNRYFGALGSRLPEFRPGPIAATEMACDDLSAEGAFFAALSSMTRVEVSAGPSLTLTAPDGRRMTFFPAGG